MANTRTPFDPHTLGFDAASSTALLVACDVSTHSPSLVPLPEACKSVVELQQCLADPELCGFGNVVPILNQRHPDAIEVIAEACVPLQERERALNDCLLIYFAGHGLLSHHDQSLLLAMRNTRTELADETALAVASLQRLISRCKVAYSVLIVDCCYAGAAITKAMPPEMLKSLEDTARFVICSSSPRQKSETPAAATTTGFCAALLDAMRSGVPNGKTTLSLRSLMAQAGALCKQRKLPDPWFNFTTKAVQGTELEFVRNRAYRPAAQIVNVEKFLIKLEPEAQQRLRQAIAEDKRLDSMAATAKQLDRDLYAGIVADRGYVDSAFAKWAVEQPFFREYFNTAKHPQTWKMFLEQVEMTVAIGGDTAVRWVRRFRTTAKLCHIWAFMSGDEAQIGIHALQARFTFRSIHRPHRAYDVVPLLLLNDPNRKEFVLYIVPEVPKGQTFELEMNYRWPKLFAPLINKGEDYWDLKVDTTDVDVPELSITFDLPGSTNPLEVTNSAQMDGVLTRKAKGNRTRTTYMLTHVADGTDLRLNLQRTGRTAGIT